MDGRVPKEFGLIRVLQKGLGECGDADDMIMSVNLFSLRDWTGCCLSQFSFCPRSWERCCATCERPLLRASSCVIGTPTAQDLGIKGRG